MTIEVQNDVCSCGSSLLLLYICLYMFFSSLFAVDFIRRYQCLFVRRPKSRRKRKPRWS